MKTSNGYKIRIPKDMIAEAPPSTAKMLLYVIAAGGIIVLTVLL